MPDTDVHPTAALPYLTADLPGTGGVIKQYNEDFVVEELPLYPASGEGTHVYALVEKRGLTTLAAIEQVARHVDRQRRDIGYAGLKDAHGVTRQWISIEHVDPEAVRAIANDRLRVIDVARHTNKIKLGHLSGNRFEIAIRDADAGSFPRARAVLDQLAARGAPNYYGPQRFGARGDNAAIGAAVLRGEYDTAVALMLGRPGPVDHGQVRRARELYDAGDLEQSATLWRRGFPQQFRLCRAMLESKGNPRKAWRAVDLTLQKLMASAFQSELFNRVVAERIGGLNKLLDGDLAWKHSNGACFRVEVAEAEQPRCDRFEISPSGPLFGPRMTEASGHTAEVEDAILAASGFTKEQITSRDMGKMNGARRPLRVPLGEPSVETGEDERGPFLKLRFSLPAGSYATIVTREVCKAGGPENQPDSAPES